MISLCVLSLALTATASASASALAVSGSFNASSSMAQAQELANRQKIATVKQLELQSYLGLWYNMYTDKFSDKTSFKGGKCPTALYTLRENGKEVSVHNYETVGGATDGSTGIDTIDGYAYVPNPAEPGQFKLYLEGAGPDEVPYWVVALGPLNAVNQYDYSIVSDNTGLSLFVLARDAKVFKAKYDAEVQSLMKSLGFTGLFTSPIVTYQGDDCVYEKK